MRSLILLTGIFLSSSSSSCQKLVCDDKVINGDGSIERATVSFTNGGGGSKKFDPSHKTVLIIHGFTIEYRWAFDMAEKWLEREPVNVFVVEWPSRFSDGQYMAVALSTELVASEISEEIKKLEETYGAELNGTFHFVGHSLGAHIAGQAARLLNSNGTSVVHRVTGFDPAYPCFENESASLKLKKSDAEFVDVYHTNSGPGKNEGNLGIYDLTGHVDFYLNGGNHQPECIRKQSACSGILECIVDKTRKFITRNRLTNIICSTVSFFMRPAAGVDTRSIMKNAIESTNYCDHGAAFGYFTDSLDRDSQKRWWASPAKWPLTVTRELRCQNRRCCGDAAEECIEMGINAELYEKSSGAFYIDTSDDVIDCPNF